MTQWIEKINNAKSLEELENLRIDTLGKKGVLTLEFAKMKSVPNEDKKAFAENLNIQKTLITQALDTKKLVLEKDALNEKLEA
ncbi:phenylalanine--tRNA ligase subunit alpha, partial [Aliarcobacter butzleri]|nr:phenylalanine--tRNA ligase subunit alpha [Aliarcobacter butzleri]